MTADHQRTLDEEHLKLLSLFYYISAGIAAFFAFFPTIYIAMGIFMLLLSRYTTGNAHNAPPAFMGWIFIVMGTVVSLLIVATAVARFLTGKWLKERKHRGFCLAIAGLSCLSMPYGTVLGVFTFVVLFRESVKQVFAEHEAGPP